MMAATEGLLSIAGLKTYFPFGNRWFGRRQVAQIFQRPSAHSPPILHHPLKNDGPVGIKEVPLELPGRKSLDPINPTHAEVLPIQAWGDKIFGVSPV